MRDNTHTEKAYNFFCFPRLFAKFRSVIFTLTDKSIMFNVIVDCDVPT